MYCQVPSSLPLIARKTTTTKDTETWHDGKELARAVIDHVDDNETGDHPDDRHRDHDADGNNDDHADAGSALVDRQRSGNDDLRRPTPALAKAEFDTLR